MVQIKKISIVILVLFICFSCISSNGKKSLSYKTYEVDGVELYHSLGGVSTRMQKEFDKIDLKLVYSINGGYIDKDQDFNIDKKVLSDRLDKILPDLNTEIIMILDLEGKYMHNLRRTESKEEYEKIINYYIEVYNYAKSLRPKATIGFYGFPWRDYWNRDDNWREDNDKLAPLLETVDAFFPSFYDFYKDKVKNGVNQDVAYACENTMESLRMAIKHKKPVYPFVWHRYHNSNKKLKYQLIPKDEYSKHVNAVATCSYEGQHVDGIIWWSSERYWYNISERGKKMRGVEGDYDKFFDSTSFEYLEVMKNAIKSKD